MNIHPNLAALGAALLFGIVVFPWKSTVVTLGQSGMFLFVGATYLATGIILYRMSGFSSQLTGRVATIGVVMALMYVGALLCCNYAFAHPNANLPIAAAITAAYPLVSAAITVVLLGQRFTFRETVFFLMAVIGVSGLGLSSK